MDKEMAGPSKEGTPSKKLKTLSTVYMNETYSDSDFIQKLNDAFCEKKKVTFENGAEILKEPFTCCILPNFFQPTTFIEELKEEVSEIDVDVKLSDLYQFKQSQDLATCSMPSISSLRKALSEDCLDWMKKVTSIPLTEKVDMSCSCYTYTDHLLCHDDELEGRRIAYIYYLVNDWDEKDGGTLDLFNTADGEPDKIVTSLVPASNKLIFFEVGPASFHQVSEVLAFKTRTTISGWFYGPPLEPAVHCEESIVFHPPTYHSVNVLKWINPTYLQPDTQLSIRESFEESSEIELMDFLQEGKYKDVCNALKNCNSWMKMGPPSRRKYEKLDLDEATEVLKECHNVFCSEPFFLILSNLTGLPLHPACSEESTQMGEVNSTFRKWRLGSYSLLHDQAFNKFATLNASLCFNCKNWDSESGGYTSYVATDEKEELLRVDPKPNSLALVYITEGTSNFVKYINCKSKENAEQGFYDIFSMYMEKE